MGELVPTEARQPSYLHSIQAGVRESMVPAVAIISLMALNTALYRKGVIPRITHLNKALLAALTLFVGTKIALAHRQPDIEGAVAPIAPAVAREVNAEEIQDFCSMLALAEFKVFRELNLEGDLRVLYDEWAASPDFPGGSFESVAGALDRECYTPRVDEPLHASLDSVCSPYGWRVPRWSPEDSKALNLPAAILMRKVLRHYATRGNLFELERLIRSQDVTSVVAALRAEIGLRDEAFFTPSECEIAAYALASGGPQELSLDEQITPLTEQQKRLLAGGWRSFCADELPQEALQLVEEVLAAHRDDLPAMQAFLHGCENPEEALRYLSGVSWGDHLARIAHFLQRGVAVQLPNREWREGRTQRVRELLPKVPGPAGFDLDEEQRLGYHYVMGCQYHTEAGRGFIRSLHSNDTIPWVTIRELRQALEDRRGGEVPATVAAEFFADRGIEIDLAREEPFTFQLLAALIHGDDVAVFYREHDRAAALLRS